MARQKKDNLADMPSDPNARKAVVNAVKEMVESLVRKQAEMELLGSIKEVTEEKYNICPKWLDTQAKFLYDTLYNENKAAIKAKELAERLEQYETYFS